MTVRTCREWNVFLAQYKQLVLRTETFFNAERIKVI